MTTSKQPGPDIPSEAVTSQPEKQKDDPKQLKKEHLDAKPGPVILTEGQASKIEQPKSKEELQRKAKEMNEGWIGKVVCGKGYWLRMVGFELG